MHDSVHNRLPRRPPFLLVLSEGIGVTSSICMCVCVCGGGGGGGGGGGRDKCNTSMWERRRDMN